jgi:hypothetical protein
MPADDASRSFSAPGRFRRGMQAGAFVRDGSSDVGLPGRSRHSRPSEVDMSNTQVAARTEIRPFTVEIAQDDLDDLRRRIAETRWPDKELVADRTQGVQLAVTQELARYWLDDYDFGRLEARLNALPQFVTEIDGHDVHFIHVRSSHEDALPLIMTHGWPGSVIEQIDTVGPLTDPTAHGGSAEDAFHLVLPSMPGYGFSSRPAAFEAPGAEAYCFTFG